jgi:putative flippase GtrA
LFQRWLKFNLVGLFGAIVQTVMLAVLAKGAHLSYLWATGLAVETAILHNFVWHEAFTWKDSRLPGDARSRLIRLLRFNLSNGVVSMIGTLLVMWVLTGIFKWPYLLSNVTAIGLCALLNFYLSEHHIFVTEPDPPAVP